MDKTEIQAVLKYLQKKCKTRKEIYKDIGQILTGDFPYNTTVKWVGAVQKMALDQIVRKSTRTSDKYFLGTPLPMQL